MTHKKVVVIGAGPGGLASAMLLASAGAEVTVIEREAAVGGRTSTMTKDGFRFDRGPTFFLFPEVLESIFRAAGHSLHDEVELKRLDPNYRLQFEQGGAVDATSDIGRLKEEIARLDPADARNLDRYLADNRRKFEHFRPILESPFSSHADLLKLPLLELLPLMRPFSSVDSDLRRWFRDPRTRLAFSFQSKYLGMSPFRCPSLFTILAFLEYEFGVFHPVGGCGAVSEAMARVAARLGVEFRLGERVEEIRFEGRRARGVTTTQRDYDCDALVVNADFANAMRRLVPDRLRRRWKDRRIDRAKMSCSTFMLYLGVEGQFPELPHHTIYLSKEYEKHLSSIDRDHVLPESPSLYVHNPSMLDSTLAPDGHSSLYVLVPVTGTHPNVDFEAEKHRFRDVVLDRLSDVGLGDIRSRIRSETLFTPADWERQLGLFRGATFSLAHSLDQMLSLRPHNRFEDLEGVYLTGGGTHPGSGLPVIYQSAKISSTLVAEDLGLRAPAGRGPRRGTALPALATETA
ncbi:MAG: phytoene desaturase [Gammaproteobacteria bacterium]|nr:phytoene desaturase [Gammaproteobacteria bacterium]